MKKYEYTTNNKDQYLCSICDAWNAAYNLNRGQIEYRVPEEAGEGRLTGISLSRGIRIIDYGMNFSEPIEIHGISREPHLDLLFCLGEHMNWGLPESGKDFELLTGESYIGVSSETKKQSIFPAKRNIHILEIKMPLDRIQDILGDVQREGEEEFSTEQIIPYGRYGMTPSVQVILQQLLNCPYPASLRQLYMEGKLLELAAVYLHEVLHQRSEQNRSSLSAEDIQCVYEAKKILDNRTAEALSLMELSKLVGINEYKLKKGFRELFKTSVHHYVIHRRLESAKLLLDKNEITVSEAAYRVGYGNVSHFAAAFRKKYGINPGKYLRAIRSCE